MAANIADVFRKGNVAVITGSSSGIGLGMARKCADASMHVFLLDYDGPALLKAQQEISARGAVCHGILTDVSQREQVEKAKDQVLALHPSVHFLFCNAGTTDGGNALAPLPAWETTIGTNMWGVMHVCQVFLPAMLASNEPGIVVNTGSKQGITLPPGTALSYNVSKAAVKAYTEGLQHELRNMKDCKVTAHLLVPAFVFTMLIPKAQMYKQARTKKEEVLTSGGSTADGDAAFLKGIEDFDKDAIQFGEHYPDKKPADAWTSDQTADFIMDKLGQGSFYLVQPEADESADGTKTRLRMTWSMNDVLQDRPPMSRWEEGHNSAFESFMSEGLKQ